MLRHGMGVFAKNEVIVDFKQINWSPCRENTKPSYRLGTPPGKWALTHEELNKLHLLIIHEHRGNPAKIAPKKCGSYTTKQRDWLNWHGELTRQTLEIGQFASQYRPGTRRASAWAIASPCGLLSPENGADQTAYSCTLPPNLRAKQAFSPYA